MLEASSVALECPNPVEDDVLAAFRWLMFDYIVNFSFQSEKLLLYDTVQSELEEKIRRLEEDRHSIDITSGN